MWRQGAEPGSEPRQLPLPDVTKAGEVLEVKGAAYDASGARIALALGQLVHDTATNGTREAARLGDSLRTFMAEPRWMNGMVMVSGFEGARPER